MTKLNELIAELCPDGVEYKTLGEVCEMQRGTSLTKANSVEGEYPVISGGKEPAFYCNQYNRDGETITVAGSGAGAGFVQFWDKNIFVNDAFSVKGNENLSTKFVYYCLANLQEEIYATKKGGGVPHVHISSIENFKIPVPPLPVQEEIVRILDKFTSLTAELTAELTARRAQYEYYRDALLTPPFTYGYKGQSGRHPELDSGSANEMLKHATLASVASLRRVQHDVNDNRKPVCEYKKLSEIFDTRNGYTPSTSNPDFWENGTIPWFVMDDIRKNGRVLSQSIQHVTKSAVKKSGLFPANSIIIATSATIGEHALITTDFLCNQRFTCLSPKSEFKNQIDMKFMFYYAFKLDEFCKKNTTVSSFASVDMSKFYNFEFPLPPLSVQERIVSVLDNFDAICADLKIGLPAEIEARKKQYEYYRDLLLTFAERGNTILTEDRRQKTEDRRQKTEDRRQKTEDRR